MTSRRSIIILLPLLLVVVALAAFLCPSEPQYKNRPLSAWLPHLGDRGDTRFEAEEAIRYLGTKAVPHLIRELRVRDSSLLNRVRFRISQLPFVNVSYAPAVERHWRAALACEILGSDAREAGPALIALLELKEAPGGRALVAGTIVDVLGEDAFDPLRDAFLNSENPSVRLDVADTLLVFKSLPDEVISMLETGLHDPHPEVQRSCAYTLGRLAPYGPLERGAAEAFVFRSVSPFRRLLIIRTGRAVE